MDFDHRKYEAIQFSWKSAFLNQEIKLSLPVSTNSFGELNVIKPIPKKASMRWLGLHFDPRLSFSERAEKMASKRRKAVSELSMLVKTTRGIEAFIMRKAVHACILPILTSGALTRWPRPSRIHKQGLII